MKLRITGFGACMIAGFPLGREHSFMSRAVEVLRECTLHQVELNIASLGGFPATRATRRLSSRVLADYPDVIVLQFGSTDASAPLRHAFGRRHHSKKTKAARENYSTQPPTHLDLWKWRVRSLLSDFLHVPPLTAPDDYLLSMLRMTNESLMTGSQVIVVSPFVLGSSRSNRFAARYTHLLEASLPNNPSLHFLNAHALLSSEPRRQMLLPDGFHLSAAAHQRVGDALGFLLAKIVPAAYGYKPFPHLEALMTASLQSQLNDL